MASAQLVIFTLGPGGNLTINEQELVKEISALRKEQAQAISALRKEQAQAISALREELAHVKEELEKRPTTISVDAEVAKKADKKYVEEELEKRASTISVDAEVAKKADSKHVEEELAKKADFKSVTSQLDKKATTFSVEEELAKKADRRDVASELEKGLAKKASIVFVQTGLDQKADRGGSAASAKVLWFVTKYPHRWSFFIALFCAIICALDCLVWLPHPVAEPLGAEGAVRKSAEHGLPSAVIRQRYNKRLDEWSKTADSLAKNLKYKKAVGSESPICHLAAQSVAERHAARVESRLQGSVLVHFVLILRDLFIYRSFDAFTLEAMMKQKKKKLSKSGQKSVTVDEVCEAIVDSSSRSNEAYTNLAESSQGVGYKGETVLWYSPSLVIMVLVYVGEWVGSKKKEEAEGKKAT